MNKNPDLIREHHSLLVKYLLMKVEQADWHGCCDASNDLRELEAAHPEIFAERGKASRI